MTRLASRFGRVNSVSRDRPLTHDELAYYEDPHPGHRQPTADPRRWEDKKTDLWTVFQRLQENLTKGGLSGISAKGKRTQTRAVNGIDSDIKLNRALWVMAERLKQAMS